MVLVVVVSIEGSFFFVSPSVCRGRIQSVISGCAFSKTVTHVDLGVSFFEEPIDQLFF